MEDRCWTHNRFFILFQELAQRLAHEEQERRGLEIEKGDLLEAYRSVLQVLLANNI